MSAGVPPSGVVTFLFTVEGSTRRWEADAEGMRAALAEHDEVLRNVNKGYLGTLCWVSRTDIGNKEMHAISAAPSVPR